MAGGGISAAAAAGWAMTAVVATAADAAVVA
eukprot:CAMPEP_0172920034 /NCGR_PEP_ID=MMETSP1075-20121228/203262_1 /TAXON_ID=2916 /ORGANISM="Ceratium fusus, Strain PA161109" /LENGTH=30 /DNA_ID= /DNA_START= /DNA_END= /DNA_ORIENTATION=